MFSGKSGVETSMLSESANLQTPLNTPQPSMEKSGNNSCCCGSFKKLEKKWQALIITVLLVVPITSIVLAITLTKDITPNQGN